MTPRVSLRDSEREVADFARRASTYMQSGPLRRFARDGRMKLIDDGRALRARLEAHCNQVEREIAGLADRAREPGVVERTKTLTHELDAGQCQLLRLSTVLDELRADGQRSTPSRSRGAVTN